VFAQIFLPSEERGTYLPDYKHNTR